MKKKLYLIINQHAGGGLAEKYSQQVLEKLKEKQVDYEAFYTEYPNHSTEIATYLYYSILLPHKEAIDATNETLPLLVVLGGDGTLHEVMNAIHPLDSQMPIGYIPCGSGNDFARGLQMPRQPLLALDHLLGTEKPRSVNILHYQDAEEHIDGYAFNNLGIGLEARIVATTNQSAAKKNLNKFKLGAFAYLYSVIKVLLQQKGFPLEITTPETSYHFDNAFLCTVTNHPYFGGGIPVAPDASPFEENMDVVLIERISLIKILILASRLIRGQHMDSKYVFHIQAKNITLSAFTPQPIQTDGETAEEKNYHFNISTTTGLFWL